MGDSSSWKTLDDVLKNFQQASIFQGTKAFQIPPPKERRSKHREPSSDSQSHKDTKNEPELYKQDLLKQQLIREACGEGYSNELIEYRWGSDDVSARAAQMLGLPSKQTYMSSLEVPSESTSPMSTRSNPSPINQFGTKHEISYRAASPPPSVSSLEINLSSSEESLPVTPKPTLVKKAAAVAPLEPRCRNALIKGLLKKSPSTAGDVGVSSSLPDPDRATERPLLKSWGYGPKEEFTLKNDDFPALM